MGLRGIVMITRDQVCQAVDMEFKERWSTDPVIRRLALCLAIYRDQNECNGTVDSAIECLSRAGYEIEGYSWYEE